MIKQSGTDAERKAVMRRLRARAFTLVQKLTEFEDLAHQIYPTTGIPSTQNLMQEMMSFYSSGCDH